MSVYDSTPYGRVELAILPPPPRRDQPRKPDLAAVLYAGDDAVELFERAAIRDGRREDVAAYADRAWTLVTAEFEQARLAARRTLEPAVKAWQQADKARREATA